MKQSCSLNFPLSYFLSLNQNFLPSGRMLLYPRWGLSRHYLIITGSDAEPTCSVIRRFFFFFFWSCNASQLHTSLDHSKLGHIGLTFPILPLAYFLVL